MTAATSELVQGVSHTVADHGGGVMLVAGARPNFVKIAPILAALQRADVRHSLVHTGQHYDASMSESFFRDLAIRKPDYHLGVGSGSHAVQTARVMQEFEQVFVHERPRWLVVVGDVNSTFACALVAAKLRAETGVRIAHVEAGLRSADWRMPEEVNRVLTDRLADVLFLPSRDARKNLLAEGIQAERIVFVGNVMVDTLIAQLPKARAGDRATVHGVTHGGYALVTLHRPSNVDDAERMCVLLTALDQLAENLPVVFPMHPRTLAATERFGLTGLLKRVRRIPPEGYLDMLSLVDTAAVVVTDSGGLQEETTALGVPCVTVREQTERPVTITEGTNRLVQWPPTVPEVLRTVQEAVRDGAGATKPRQPEGWDGHAAERIVEYLVDSEQRFLDGGPSVSLVNS